jgi:hypothetical protein
MDYDEFQQSEFASFFNVQEVERFQEPNGCMRLHLKTGGFQESIDIELKLDASLRLRQASLELARAWIGNEDSLNPFAKDICKSFIHDLADVSNKKIQDLVEGIWDLHGKKDEVIYLKPPTPPVTRSAETQSAIRVFCGILPVLELNLPKFNLTMENIEISGKTLLRVILIFKVL